MPYELYVTRAKRWSDNGDRRISFDEWLELVEGDDELAFDDMLGPSLARWDGFSSFEAVILEWRQGNVSTQFKDEFVVEKMLDIASRLGARVQSDLGAPFPGPDDDPYRTRD